MPIASEEKLFTVCLNREKRDIMIKALDTYLDKLEKIQASRIVTRETRLLKEEIEKMRTC